MEYHGGLINYWNEHYNIGLFITLISIIYLIMSYEYISCLVQRHHQQQQISLSGLFFYLIISSGYLYYLMELHRMDLITVVIFILYLILIIYLPFLGLLIGVFSIGLLSIPLALVGENSLLGKLLSLLGWFLNLLIDRSTKFLSLVRKKILELLESELCK